MKSFVKYFNELSDPKAESSLSENLELPKQKKQIVEPEKNKSTRKTDLKSEPSNSSSKSANPTNKSETISSKATPVKPTKQDSQKSKTKHSGDKKPSKNEAKKSDSSKSDAVKIEPEEKNDDNKVKHPPKESTEVLETMTGTRRSKRVRKAPEPFGSDVQQKQAGTEKNPTDTAKNNKDIEPEEEGKLKGLEDSSVLRQEMKEEEKNEDNNRKMDIISLGEKKNDSSSQKAPADDSGSIGRFISLSSAKNSQCEEDDISSFDIENFDNSPQKERHKKQPDAKETQKIEAKTNPSKDIYILKLVILSFLKVLVKKERIAPENEMDVRFYFDELKEIRKQTNQKIFDFLSSTHKDNLHPKVTDDKPSRQSKKEEGVILENDIKTSGALVEDPRENEILNDPFLVKLLGGNVECKGIFENVRDIDLVKVSSTLSHIRNTEKIFI